MIKAIETRYKGYRFRSRLEARWAVYFDAIGLEWEYEKEGFNLDGLLYLPDFWLSQIRMWAEVKPEPPSLEEGDKACALANGTKHSVLMLVGTPSPPPRTYIVFNPSNDSEPNLGNLYVGPWLYGLPHHPEGMSVHNALWFAVEAARSARFEHGENG